jgi:hypothetical protein
LEEKDDADCKLVLRGGGAQHPLDPRYPVGMLFEASAGRLFCEVALEYPAPAPAIGSSSATFAASLHPSPRLGYRTVRTPRASPAVEPLVTLRRII